MKKFSLLILLLLFSLQTTPSYTLELKLKIPKDLKKLGVKVKDEIGKKKKNIKKEEVKKEEVKKEEVKKEEVKKEEFVEKSNGSFEGIKIVHINGLKVPIFNLEYDIKKGTGLINIEPPKKYADQVVSFDFKIFYDHLIKNDVIKTEKKKTSLKTSDQNIRETIEEKELTKDQTIMKEYNEHVRYIEIGLTELFEKAYVNDQDFNSSVKYISQHTDLIINEIFRDLHEKINEVASANVVKGQGKSVFYNQLLAERKDIIINSLKDSEMKTTHCYPNDSNSYGNCKGPEIYRNWNNGTLKPGGAHKTVKKLLEKKYNKYKPFVCIKYSEGEKSCENPDSNFINDVKNKLNEIKKDLPKLESLIYSQYYVTLKYFPIDELKNLEKNKSKEFIKFTSNKIKCQKNEIWFNGECINENSEFDTLFFIKMHDQAFENGKKTFTFLDNKSYKVQPKKLINIKRKENEELFLSGQKEIKYENELINICNYVYCNTTEIFNDKNGYLGKKINNYYGKNVGTRAEFFNRLFGEYINKSFAKAHDANIIDNNELLELQKKINEFKSRLKKGYIGFGGRNLLTEEAKNNEIYLYEDLKTVAVQNKQDFFLITKIEVNGPADHAGLKVGDVLLTIDNERILGREQLVNYLALNHSKIIQIEIWREKKLFNTKIKLGSKKVDGDELYNLELHIKKYDKKLNQLKKKEKTFEFSVDRSSTNLANYPVGLYPIGNYNKLFIKEISSYRDFINNEVKLLVNEKKLSYPTTYESLYQNNKRIWNIKYYEPSYFLNINNNFNNYYAGRFSLKVLDYDSKEIISTNDGYYFFYKQ